MLNYRLQHPQLLQALAEAGHGSQVLIADGNYPLATKTPATAHRVYLNLAPDVLKVTDVLAVLLDAAPFEAAHVMQPDAGPEPPVFAEFRSMLPGIDLQPLERFAFYDAASQPEVHLAILTGERRLYANLLLTIGYRKPDR